MNIPSLDLTQEAPRSPHLRLGGYVILARTIDKCRASLNDKIGEYHYDCPLDNMLFSFAGVTGADFKTEIEGGASDSSMVDWLNRHGTKHTHDEITAWSDGMVAVNLSKDPEKGEWFAQQCAALDLDPAKTSLFQWLDADDRASYVAA